MAARLDNTGQSCNAAKRFIVVDGLYDAFLEKFTAAMRRGRAGDPIAEETISGRCRRCGGRAARRSRSTGRSTRARRSSPAASATARSSRRRC